jgi:hypothetical protein
MDNYSDKDLNSIQQLKHFHANISMPELFSRHQNDFETEKTKKKTKKSAYIAERAGDDDAADLVDVEPHEPLHRVQRVLLELHDRRRPVLRFLRVALRLQKRININVNVNVNIPISKKSSY